MSVSVQVAAVAMARPGRPASESYQPVSFSSDAVRAGAEDEDDGAPIFSLSKSSMDVLMAAGPPHKRDPTWTTMDLRRSSSTNTHSDNSSLTLKQLHPHIWQHVNVANVHQADVHTPPVLSERWISNMQRWSQCSGSTHSRSSTPDTIVWRDDNSRPSSLTQETLYSATLDSPTSKPSSPPAEPSPLISPLQTPNLPPEDLLTSSPSPLMLSPNHPKDFPMSSPTSPPLPSPQRAYTSSPLMSSSPNLLRLNSTEDEGNLDNQPEYSQLSFTFSSPLLSSVSLIDGGTPSDSGCLAEVIRELQGPEGATQLLEDEGVKSPAPTLNSPMPNSPVKEPESVVCFLELPWQPEPSCLTGRSWRSPLVASLSDSHLADCCPCHNSARESIMTAPKIQMFKEEGTMTLQPETVDVAVQTLSPIGSLWGLKRNISISNMGSHSILGSPPGSRLNLKSSVGSNSNLVSPSSSMFPGSSAEEEEEEKPEEEQTGNSSHDLERRRSCLKIQGEEKDEIGRRSSMKQVQWDEDGMTWDVHGASPEPEVLKTAIQRHLEVQSSPQPAKSASKKKKKAPLPPLLTDVVKAKAPELHPPATSTDATLTVQGADEGGATEEKEGGTKEETPEAARRVSRAEGANMKEDDDDEVYGEEGISSPKPPSRGSTQIRKKSVIKSLRRPGWCGGSKKTS